MISNRKRSLLAALLMLILIGLTACDVSQRKTNIPGGAEPLPVSPAATRTAPTDNPAPDVNRQTASPSLSPTERGYEQASTEPPVKSDENINCTDSNPLQAWFCDGFGWGQVMLALQTGKITGEEPGALLETRRGGLGWGDIWRDKGLIGRPEHAGPPNDENGDGRPDFAGPPADNDGDGKPDFAGPPNGNGWGRGKSRP